MSTALNRNEQILIETDGVNVDFYIAVVPLTFPGDCCLHPVRFKEFVIMVIKVYIASSSGSTSVRTSETRLIENMRHCTFYHNR